MINDAVSCLSPMKSQILISAHLNILIAFGTPSCEKEFHKLLRQQDMKLEQYRQLNIETMKNIEENLTKLNVTKTESKK